MTYRHFYKCIHSELEITYVKIFNVTEKSTEEVVKHAYTLENG